MSTLRLLALAVALAPASGASAQSVLERTPNTGGVWTLDAGRPVFTFSHRFELLSGGDEVLNFPTLTLAVGLPLGLTAGLDFTSNSEVVPARLAGNETQYWLKRAVRVSPTARVAGVVAYNTAAESVDGSINILQRVGPAALVGEVRGFRRMFGSEQAGTAATAGALLEVTPYLALAADWGRVLGHDTLDSVWSAGVGIAIPGTPHTLSLHAANTGATTLQGTSRRKTIGPASVRYGFVFTVPLGARGQWARIFRPTTRMDDATSVSAADTAEVRVEIRRVAFSPGEVRIRAGQQVEWINLDPVVHTVTAQNGNWGSELLNEGDRFVHRFDRPGRYPYHCLPHPMMTGTVIVEP